MADYAVRLGPAPARESYLSVPALLEAARRTRRRRLVHPGYGFLAENAGFARACADAGLTFVGPTPEAIAAMGSKTGAASSMRKAGVPVVPGSRSAGRRRSARARARSPRQAGYPDPAQGVRRRRRQRDAPGRRRGRSRRPPSSGVSAEALASFGDGAVYAEKLIERPRHVEVQVSATAMATSSRVGERECSCSAATRRWSRNARRRCVDEDLRAAPRRGGARGGAGRGLHVLPAPSSSCSAPDRSFYFLEMNTRLQVEHPVTERSGASTSRRRMIRIALGEPLPFASRRPRSPAGHAIECRVYAEDPPAELRALARDGSGPAAAAGPRRAQRRRRRGGLRRAHRLRPDAGQARGARRESCPAIARLARALDDYEIAGVETTLPLFRALVRDREFGDADFDVQWLDRRLADGLLPEEPATSEEVCLAAAVLAAEDPAVMEPADSSAGSLWRTTARREALGDAPRLTAEEADALR